MKEEFSNLSIILNLTWKVEDGSNLAAKVKDSFVLDEEIVSFVGTVTDFENFSRSCVRFTCTHSFVRVQFYIQLLIGSLRNAY